MKQYLSWIYSPTIILLVAASSAVADLDTIVSNQVPDGFRGAYVGEVVGVNDNGHFYVYLAGFQVPEGQEYLVATRQYGFSADPRETALVLLDRRVNCQPRYVTAEYTVADCNIDERSFRRPGISLPFSPVHFGRWQSRVEGGVWKCTDEDWEHDATIPNNLPESTDYSNVCEFLEE